MKENELQKLRVLTAEVKAASPFSKAAFAERWMDEVVNLLDKVFQQQHSRGGSHGSEENSSKTSSEKTG